ncbi:MAG: AMP-binding protein, partial [Coriobacteriia bacterium]|nr:AMP-binding protein [Coriobacteriia bacterium]
MDHIISRYCPRVEFSSYKDFAENFRIESTEDFNFAYDVVDEWARVEPEKRALVWCDDDGGERTFTFTDISRLSNRMANAFSDIGIGKGDVVMLVLRRRWEYWVTAVALHKIGAILIPGSVQLTTKDIVYRAESAAVKMMVCVDDEYVLSQVEGARPEATTIEKCIVAGPAREGWLSFDELLESHAEDWTRPTGDAFAGGRDTMLVYFTSGTTGLAKMVMHDFIHPLGHIVTARYWQQVRENELHFTVSDSGWAKFGWGKIYGQWICGVTILGYDMKKFVPTEL